jgi:hypothetical protein
MTDGSRGHKPPGQHLMQQNEPRRFPKLSSFSDTKKADEAPPPSKGAKMSLFRRLGKHPNLFKIPQMTRTTKKRTTLPVILAVILVGLILLIDFPFSKQKPPPPADPRFADASNKPQPPLERSQRATAQEEKTEAIPQNTPPPQASGSQSLAPQEKRSSPKNGKVIGNSDTKRYHLQGMKYYDVIKAYHRVEFHSEKEALAAGYRKARE